MAALQLGLVLLYAFLAAVALLSARNIWAMHNNPFASYLGGSIWIYHALNAAVIAASLLSAMGLVRRSGSAPRLAIGIAWCILLAYLGKDVLIGLMMKNVPFDRFVGLES